MKTVSHFELLVKRILPLADNPGTVVNEALLPNSASNAVARRVVQGHFLTISNLELDRPLYFSVSYVVADSSSDGTQDAFRDLLFDPANPALPIRNFDLRFDGDNASNNVDAALGATLFSATVPPFPFRVYRTLKTRNLLLGPGETGLLAMFPNFVPGPNQPPALANLLNPALTISPQFEMRGYVKIQQEAFSGTSTNSYVGLPANVLITSETRGTFLDNEYGNLTTELAIGGGPNQPSIGFDFDQLAYPLPLAEGKSMYTLAGA